MLGKVLFLGRKNCLFSKKLTEYTKKRSNYFYNFNSSRSAKKFNLEKLSSKKFDYVFCFRSYFILKKNFLKSVKKAAINFHPGTPNYRGFWLFKFCNL